MPRKDLNIKEGELKAVLNLSELTNPVWRRRDNLRDPSVFQTKDGYLLFYSRYADNADGKGHAWARSENWSVAVVFTKDFVTYEGDRDITPKGFASPGDLVFWEGRYVLPLQSYPSSPSKLYYITSKDLMHWTQPELFLPEALSLPWNVEKRAIDPAFVLNKDRLYCFFVGSDDRTAAIHTNLVGYAVTKDPALKVWEIKTEEAPMIGRSASAPDGAENIVVFRNASSWVMIYSEGLVDQHLAYGISEDLYHWNWMGKVDVERQKWNRVKYGAPFVWKENEGNWMMILMGHGEDHKTTFGLLFSKDGIHWNSLRETV